MKECTSYTFEVRMVTPKVTRTFEEIKIFRELLIKEFPGLAFPPLPGNSRDYVVYFFQGVWQLPDVTSSDLFYQFLETSSTDKLFKFYNSLHQAFQTKSSLLQLFWPDKPTFSSDLFKKIIIKSESIKDVEKMPWADLGSFNDFCENQYRCVQGSLGLIGNLVNESVGLVEKVKNNIKQLEPIFMKLKIQFERLNYAKQLFPAFERTALRLDLVCDKLSYACLNLGHLRSKFFFLEDTGNQLFKFIRRLPNNKRMAGSPGRPAASNNRPIL